MENPFVQIDARLGNLESLLLELKHQLLIPKNEPQQSIVDLQGLLEARPHIGSKSTLYKKISKGLIPHSKRGKKLYFDLNEIDAWLMEHKVKSISNLKEDLASYNKKRRGR